MNTVRQVVILSAEQRQSTIESNRQRSTTLKHVLEDLNLPFNEATGVFRGFEQQSFVVIVNNQNEIETLSGLAFSKFGQECVLVQDSNQQAYLLNKDNTTQTLGKLVNVNRDVATKQDSYTYMNGKYYTTL